MRHTPGPWHAQHHMRQDGHGGSKRWHIVAGRDRSIEICQLKGWDDEDEANARLVSAAPELMQLLDHLTASMENTLLHLGGQMTPADSKGRWALAMEARKLLTRIEGQS